MKRSFLLVIGVGMAVLWIGNRLDVPVSQAPAAGFDVTTVENRVAVIGGNLAGIVREVTAYNVGVRKQTSDNPCIGATGRNLCRLVERGRKICAANFVDLGTVLKIEEYGECVVLDRMNSRYPHRVDIAMRKNEVKSSLAFGLQRRVVEVAD